MRQGVLCLVVLGVLMVLVGCKASLSGSAKNTCVAGYFVADLRGKVSPKILEYAKDQYGVTLEQVLDGSTNTSLYTFDPKLISLDEIIVMMNDSEFCESASCYSITKGK